MSDDYRPREHDHLVEPLFGGLLDGARAAPPRGRFARLVAWLRARFQRRGPGSKG